MHKLLNNEQEKLLNIDTNKVTSHISQYSEVNTQPSVTPTSQFAKPPLRGLARMRAERAKKDEDFR